MSIRQKITNEIMDLRDNVKFELSEMNKLKELVINGPSVQLMKRAIHMSYLQGQKHAIDEISMLIEDNINDDDFLKNYQRFETNVYNKSIELQYEFSNYTDIPHRFDEFLDTFYSTKGQHYIVNYINSLIV
ncbi:hypothetical protein V2J40_08620 [Staphylococcus saccharolyticus]|uniref:hypothetical protein n=1 Tax=Staphylococcus saccharolyticus TaxID=33028 RepID=UPI0032E0355C